MIHHNGTALLSKDRQQTIFDLQSRTAIIIGGGGKMGAQFGSTLVQAGAEVILADRDAQKCKAVGNEISESVEKPVQCFAVESSDENDVKDLFVNIYQQFQRIDVLVYNVMAKPTGYYKKTDDYQLQTWNSTIAGNLTGAFLCCREAAKYMKQAKSGVIVLTSSIYGVVAPDQSIYNRCSPDLNIYETNDSLHCPAVYSASKAGLIGLAKHLATLWGEYNIRVNVLTPGGVYDGQEDAFRQEYIRRTPLKRMANWSDFNGAILFLVSDASRYMTGSNLVIDGGWTAW